MNNYGNAGEPVEGWTVAEIYAIPYFKEWFNELSAEHSERFIITESEFVLFDSQIKLTDTWEQAINLLEKLSQKFSQA